MSRGFSQYLLHTAEFEITLVVHLGSPIGGGEGLLRIVDSDILWDDGYRFPGVASPPAWVAGEKNNYFTYLDAPAGVPNRFQDSGDCPRASRTVSPLLVTARRSLTVLLAYGLA